MLWLLVGFGDFWLVVRLFDDQGELFRDQNWAFFKASALLYEVDIRHTFSISGTLFTFWLTPKINPPTFTKIDLGDFLLFSHLGQTPTLTSLLKDQSHFFKITILRITWVLFNDRGNTFWSRLFIIFAEFTFYLFRSPIFTKNQTPQKRSTPSLSLNQEKTFPLPPPLIK